MSKNLNQNRLSVKFPTAFLYLSGHEWVSADVSKMVSSGKLAAARAMLEHAEALEAFMRSTMPWNTTEVL